DCLVDPASEVPADQPEEAADHQTQPDGRQRYDQRYARPVDETREDIATELVGAEDVLGVGQAAARAEVLGSRVLGRQVGREGGSDDQDDYDAQTDKAQAVTTEAPPDAAQTGPGSRPCRRRAHAYRTRGSIRP